MVTGLGIHFNEISSLIDIDLNIVSNRRGNKHNLGDYR